MKVLLIGGGGREHALGWKIAQSPHLSKLYLAPGNPGLNRIGEALSIDVDNNEAVVDFARSKSLDLVIVGPEAPLANGLADDLATAGVHCFGPRKNAARLESSKAFMKEICTAAGAPTAKFGKFSDAAAAKDFLDSFSAPYVVKADGLAAGKGVVIADTREEAAQAIDGMFSGKFGAAGEKIIIEEFLKGEEASFFVLCDGENIAPMVAAQDHKRAFDGDKGPNTGGMGAYSPAPVFSGKVREQTIKEIIEPVVREMKNRGAPFSGVLFAGLMIDEAGPKLIEFNARFGDPECQVMMRLLKSDILPALHACAVGDLKGVELQWSNEACALVVLAANGYPGKYQKGSKITGVEKADSLDGTVVFHAGTVEKGGELLANGGRVLNVTATAPTISEAVARAYAGVKKIHWPEGFYRSDIGWRAVRGVS